MAGNVFGKLLTLTSFGESHGKAIGGIIDGFPAGLTIDLQKVQEDLNRRRPGSSIYVTSRKEEDKAEFLSGIMDNVTLGTPIAFIIENKDHRSSDYTHIKNIYRPSHADYTYDKKYGIRDHRGGGRSSARETIARVVAGSLARQLLSHYNISVRAYVNRIGEISLPKEYTEYDLSTSVTSPLACPDKETEKKMQKHIIETSEAGDTLGGEITCVISNVPAGIGEPVFNKLNAALANAIMGINAVKGIEIGSGMSASKMKGSEHNDIFRSQNKDIYTETNHSGGIQGGISNGEDIYFKAFFKPVATIMKAQQTVDNKGEETTLQNKGRHDVTVVPRAVPIVEAMACLVIADYILINRSSKI